MSCLSRRHHPPCLHEPLQTTSTPAVDDDIDYDIDHNYLTACITRACLTCSALLCLVSFCLVYPSLLVLSAWLRSPPLLPFHSIYIRPGFPFMSHDHDVSLLMSRTRTRLVVMYRRFHLSPSPPISLYPSARLSYVVFRWHLTPDPTPSFSLPTPALQRYRIPFRCIFSFPHLVSFSFSLFFFHNRFVTCTLYVFLPFLW